MGSFIPMHIPVIKMCLMLVHFTLIRYDKYWRVMIMTDRLYYDDAYLTAFDGHVLECVARENAWHVRLNRSAFYPTSGGQPHDKGTLNGISVTDVYVDEALEVWHVLDCPISEGLAVHGEIDWPRRFDHMQQHAADHMIASALWRLMGGVTIGLHISDETSTIDVAMPEGATRIGPDDIRCVEQDVNARIQRDVPVRCWFPDPSELEILPLRKRPTVDRHVRIVAIGMDEMVACGGTHPASAGQIGLVKILNVSPARGKMRVCFVAGMRALQDYQHKSECAQATAGILSTSIDRMASNVAAMQEALKRAELELGHLRRRQLLAQSEALIAEAPRLANGAALVAKTIEGDAGLLRDFAAHLIKSPGIVALLAANVGEEQAIFVFARSSDVQLHMGRLLESAAKPLSGKGGGRPDFAQGGGAPAILQAAAAMLESGEYL